MAMAALPAASAVGSAVMSGLEGAATLGTSAATLHGLYNKYSPNVKRLATSVHSLPNKAQTAKNYLKSRLTSVSGFKKLVTKDLPSAASAASKYITSGKAVKKIKEVAGDAHSAIGAIEAVTGKSEHLDKLKGVVGEAESGAERFHDQLSQYNEAGKNAINQFKQTYGA